MANLKTKTRKALETIAKIPLEIPSHKHLSMPADKRLKVQQAYSHIVDEITKKTDTVNDARQEVINMMIEFDEAGLTPTTTTPLTIAEFKEQYFKRLLFILGKDR